MPITIDDSVLRDQLNALPKKIKNKIERSAMKQINAAAATALKNAVPVRSGATKAAVGVKQIKTRNGVLGITGIRTAYKKKKKNRTIQPAHYFHILERGSKHQPGLNLIPQIITQIQPQVEAALATALNDLQ